MNERISEKTVAQQHKLLAHAEQALQSLGYETRLFGVEEQAEQLPGPLLIVGVEKDDHGRDRLLNLTYLPFPDDDDFDYLSLLQWYSQLPFAVPEKEKEAVLSLINGINAHTTIGYFGLTTAGKPFYRYVLGSEKWAEVEIETLQQLLMVMMHMQNKFAPLIEAVATGEQSAATLIAQLDG